MGLLHAVMKHVTIRTHNPSMEQNRANARGRVTSISHGTVATGLITFILLAVFLSDSAMGQQSPGSPHDDYGTMDTVYVTVQHEQDRQWLVSIDLTNDESVAAVTLPLTWRPGFEAFRLDSASYIGTRTSYFALKTFFPDTVNSTILIGLISDLGMGLPPLEPGKGRIAKLFFTAHHETSAILEVDTTFISPHNVLQLVVPDVRAILPAFESRNALQPTTKQNVRE